MKKTKRVLSMLLSLSMVLPSVLATINGSAATLDNNVFNLYSTQTYSLTFDEKSTWSEVLSDQNEGTNRLVDSSSKTLSKNIGSNATNAMYFSDSNHQLTMQQEIDNGVISVEGDFYISSIASFGSFTILDFHYDNADGSVQNWDGCKVRAYKGFSGGVQLQLDGSNVTTISTKAWHNVRMVIDRTGEYSGTDKATVYLYLDNSLVGTKTLSQKMAKLNRVAVKGKTAYLDNFKVTVYGQTSIFDNMTDYGLNSDIDMSTVKTDLSQKATTHPRVMATAADFERIKSEIKTNEDKKLWYDWLLYRGDVLLSQDTVTYTIEGGRLQKQSARFMNKMITFGMLWKLTGDEKYPQRALKEIRTVIGQTDKKFEDWHPGHHIDLGIMAAGYAVGYDWMYDYWQKNGYLSLIEQGAKDYAFNDLAGMYRTRYTRMTNGAAMTNNHNAFCNSGAIILALAFADVEGLGEDAAYIVSNAVRGYGQMNKNYKNSEGSWYEGTTYGVVNINFLSMALSTMENTLGRLYEIDTRTPELAQTWDYIRMMESDVGNFNFSDADFSPFTYCYGWLENHYNGGGFSESIVNNEGIANTDGEYLAAALLWCSGEGEYDKPTDKYYEKDSVMLMRSDNSEGQTFVGIKAGDTVYDHSQLDAGSFVFDSQGVRWAYDLGKDNYDIDGYFGFGRDNTNSLDYGVDGANDEGKRWKIFRNRAEAHNTIVVNPSSSTLADYKIGTSAPMTYVGGNNKGSFATVDMTELYGGMLTSAKRAFLLTDSRRSLVIRDELTAAEKSDIYWLMYIKADAQINENQVILTDKFSPEKKLIIDFICASDFNLSIAEAKPFNTALTSYSNAEYKRLELHTNTAAANITVKLTPVNVMGSGVNQYDKPIEKWSLNDALASDAVMEYIDGDDGQNTKKLLQEVTFDHQADISDSYKSVDNYATYYSNNVVAGSSLNWICDDNKKSDSVYIEAQEGKSIRVAGKARVNSWIKKTGLVEVEYDILIGDLGTGRYIKLVEGGFPTKSSNGSSTAWVEALRVDYNGNVISGGSVKTGYTMKENTWYHIRARFDTEKGTITSYIDNKQVAELTSANANTLTTATMLARFNIDTSQCYDTSGNYNGVVYIDNFAAKTYSSFGLDPKRKISDFTFDNNSTVSDNGDLFLPTSGITYLSLSSTTAYGGNGKSVRFGRTLSTAASSAVSATFMKDQHVYDGCVEYSAMFYWDNFHTGGYYDKPFEIKFMSAYDSSNGKNMWTEIRVCKGGGVKVQSFEQVLSDIQGVTLKTGQWYKISARVDSAERTIKYYIDDKLIHSFDYPYSGANPKASSMQIMQRDSSTSSASVFYVDNYHLYQYDTFNEPNIEVTELFEHDFENVSVISAVSDDLFFANPNDGGSANVDVNIGKSNRYLKISADTYSEIGVTTTNPYFLAAVNSTEGSAVKSGIVKYETRVCFPDFNTLKYITCPYLGTNDANGSAMYAYSFVVTPIAGGKGAVTASDDRSVFYKSIEPDTWYTLTMYIELDTNTQYFYIDGQLFHYAVWNNEMSHLVRVTNYVVTPTEDGIVSEMYMDDMIIEWVESDGYIFDCYSGELNARAVVKAADKKVLFASYDNTGKCVSTGISDSSDTAQCYEYTGENDSKTVKVMLWENTGSLLPVRNARSGNIR